MKFVEPLIHGWIIKAQLSRDANLRRGETGFKAVLLEVGGIFACCDPIVLAAQKAANLGEELSTFKQLLSTGIVF